MNARQSEVHNFYKNLHPEALILYHLPGQYMVMGEDVGRALKSYPNLQTQEPGVGFLPDDVSVLSELGADGTEVVVISYRNDAGRLDLPDIGRLQAEQEADY